MQFTATQIAAIIGADIEGKASEAITGFAKIEEGKAGMLSFIANPKYEHYLYTTASSVIIVNQSLVLTQPVKATLLRVPDAYAAFATLMEMYNKIVNSTVKKGVEQPAFVDETATLGSDVYIGAFAYIGKNVRLGNNVQIYPGCYIGDNAVVGHNSVIYSGAKVYHQSKIGERVIVHSGVVIGSDGFGFAPQADGSYKKVPQLGHVIIEDDVEIGSNTTIDRATLGATVIRKGVKIDNLVQIAHNVEIGEGTVIAAQAGIAGSTKVGNYCMIGGQAGIVGHIQIADGTKINAQSGLAKTISMPNTAVTGSPAFDYRSALKSQTVYKQLPDLLKKIQELTVQVNALSNK